MSLIELNENNFAEQVVRYGFFAEQIPPCFSSKAFSEKLDLFLPLINVGKNQRKGTSNTTAPAIISTYKNDISRRILSVPNPEAFLRVVKIYANNWSKLRTFSESENSLSPITYMRSYSEDVFVEEINCESIREEHQVKSDFIESVKECIRTAIGYQFRLTVDIANCYNSIYTHSITWAICGKENAKNYMRTQLPVSMKNDYELGDSIDAFTRFQKNNETNGIVVGPYTSRIFSEIILSAIDKILR